MPHTTEYKVLVEENKHSFEDKLNNFTFMGWGIYSTTIIPQEINPEFQTAVSNVMYYALLRKDNTGVKGLKVIMKKFEQEEKENVKV